LLDVLDEVLRKFADVNGDYSLDHSKDTKGLLSLQDISNLNMGEESLYKAKEFSRKHLASAIQHLEPNLGRYVQQSLDHPYHVSLMQYKARHHLSYMQSLSSTNIGMQELAVAEFQLNKLLNQREMQEIKRYIYRYCTCKTIIAPPTNNFIRVFVFSAITKVTTTHYVLHMAEEPCIIPAYAN
jgi:hypothetical protein